MLRVGMVNLFRSDGAGFFFANSKRLGWIYWVSKVGSRWVEEREWSIDVVML